LNEYDKFINENENSSLETYEEISQFVKKNILQSDFDKEKNEENSMNNWKNFFKKFKRYSENLKYKIIENINQDINFEEISINQKLLKDINVNEGKKEIDSKKREEIEKEINETFNNIFKARELRKNKNNTNSESIWENKSLINSDIKLETKENQIPFNRKAFTITAPGTSTANTDYCNLNNSSENSATEINKISSNEIFSFDLENNNKIKEIIDLNDNDNYVENKELKENKIIDIDLSENNNNFKEKENNDTSKDINKDNLIEFNELKIPIPIVYINDESYKKGI